MQKSSVQWPYWSFSISRKYRNMVPNIGNSKSGMKMHFGTDRGRRRDLGLARNVVDRGRVLVVGGLAVFGIKHDLHGGRAWV